MPPLLRDIFHFHAYYARRAAAIATLLFTLISYCHFDG